ncbi:P-loop containing nucleoside triphosphate hydrolase protein [Phaeosphaeriaceae sp. PMI808]|nr:P-loop containing nucleoside triphosphate hydrolase protein [Phaeosphaeriaceae sp. PMI808]
MTTSTPIEEQHTNSSEKDEEQQYVLQASWKALFGFTTKKHIPILCGGMLSALVGAATMPVFAIIYGLIFRDYTDYGSGKMDGGALRGSVTTYCLILTGIACLNWMANSLYFFFFLAFGELQARSARNRIFDALILKDMAWFDTRETGTAAFLPAIQMYIRELQLSLSAPFGEGIQCLIQGLGALGVALYYSWNLTLVVLSSVPLIYLFQSFLARRLSIRVNEQAGKLQSALKYITNAIQNIETVKCFNGEQQELHSFSGITALAARAYLRVANLRSMQIGTMQFLTLSIFVQGFWYGSYLVSSGDLSAGQVITTFWAALMAIMGITGFLPQFIVMQKGKVAGARLRLLMKQMSASDKRQEVGGHLKPLRCLGDIEFRDVYFSYPSRPEELAIRNVSLFFQAEETTFVIGKSGSGKSTLGQLLVRLYQPSSGEIVLDSLALDQTDVQWLRNNVTLVEQHSMLFNDTIGQNISLGRLDSTVSIQELKDAVTFALLEPIVQDLPGGLNTKLGIKGSSLSGGQQQKMALARAKVRDTPVLILDESTSALDYISRAAILQAIREWRKGKTTIIITHDISQIQPDDFLYVMENAQVVQEGFRKELEAQFGAFQALLASHVECEDGESDSESCSDYGDETGEITSLYEDTWGLRSPMHRPLSATRFRESFMPPFPDGNRESTAGSTFLGLEKRLTRHEDDEESSPVDKEYNSATLTEGTTKLPPALLRDRDPNIIRILEPFRSLRVDLEIRLLNQENHHDGSCETLRLHKRTARDPEQGASNEPLGILEILKTVWPTLSWRPRIISLAAFSCAAIHAACTPVFSWLFAQLLQTFYTTEDRSRRSLVYSMAILGIAIGDGLATYLLFFLSDSVAQSWTQALKVEAMRRILKQPREFFDDEENSVSRLAETLDHFAEEARNLPGRFAGVFVVIILMIGISICWSLVTCWKLALVALACGPVMFAITKSFNIISSHWEKLANEADDTVGQALHEIFVNIRTVRCLTLEHHFRAKYTQATTAAVNIGIKRALYSGSIFGLQFCSILFVAILLFWYGAILISTNQYSVTHILESFLILMLSVNHITYMSHYITQINISRSAGSRLLRLARLPTTSPEHVGGLKIKTAGSITFTKANFHYPMRDQHQVLHDVSFTLPTGTCTAIVGPSGSGKSTIASLLLKIYQADHMPDTQPPLTVSGLDVQALDTTSLRSRIALVSQTPVLFPGSIAQNIVYGLDASDSRARMSNVRAAAEAAGIAEFVESLAQGYDTVIGAGGTGLSGGQAQRIAIARALARKPDILVLDEATSALDVVSASVVRETVKRLVKSKTGVGDEVPVSPRFGGVWDASEWEGRERDKDGKREMTVVIITHAKEMMGIAEHIIMLDKGRVVEQGRFGELKRKKGGAFARLLKGEGDII